MRGRTHLLFAGLWLLFVLAGCGRTEKEIRNPEDARHARIGVMTGTTGETLTLGMFPDADVRSYDDVMEAVAALGSSKLDAIVTTYSTALQLCKKQPGFRILDETLQDEHTAIAVRKGEPALLNGINDIIDSLRADGTLADMRKRWLKKDRSPYVERRFVLPVEGEPLRVGVTATREPVSFMDKDGQVSGFDGELARIIALRLDRPVVFHNMKFMGLIPALKSGRIDLVVTGMSATPERMKSVDFSRSYFENAQVMLVRSSGSAGKEGVRGSTDAPAARASAPAADHPPDLNGRRVAVLLGSTHDTYAIANYPEATLLQYKTPSDIILAVKSGKADVAIYTTETLREIFRTDSSLQFVGGSLFSTPVAMGFNKKNDTLRMRFNVFLEGIRKNGVYDDMVERWIVRGDEAMPSISGSKANGVLRVGVVSDKGLPFMIVKNNRLIGFDEELAERFAAYLGKEIRTSDMDFSNLIAAAATNKIDMIASTLMITPERALQVGFSDPYYEIGASAFAMKRHEPEAGSGDADAGIASSFPGSIADGFNNNIVRENRWKLILEGLWVTVVISVFSALFGTLLGAGVCAMRMSSIRLFTLAASMFISLLRGTPVLVLLMLIYYVVFASLPVDPVVVAVIAFGLNFAAYTAEIFRSGIESIDKGQSEAGIAMGFTKFRTFLFIILPQTIQRILPVYKGEFLSLVKMTSVVGYIAVEDLTKAGDIIRSRTFDAFFPLVMVAALYFSISWVLLLSMEYLERKTDPKYKKRAGEVCRCS
ncbi:ABC transporter permease subunit [Chlorobium limicola]